VDKLKKAEQLHDDAFRKNSQLSDELKQSKEQFIRLGNDIRNQYIDSHNAQIEKLNQELRKLREEMDKLRAENLDILNKNNQEFFEKETELIKTRSEYQSVLEINLTLRNEIKRFAELLESAELKVGIDNRSKKRRLTDLSSLTSVFPIETFHMFPQKEEVEFEESHGSEDKNSSGLDLVVKEDSLEITTKQKLDLRGYYLKTFSRREDGKKVSLRYPKTGFPEATILPPDRSLRVFATFSASPPPSSHPLDFYWKKKGTEKKGWSEANHEVALYNDRNEVVCRSFASSSQL